MSGRSVARRTTSAGRTKNMLPERQAGARKWDIRSTAPMVSGPALAAVMRSVRAQAPALPVAGVSGGALVPGLNARMDGLGYVIEYAGQPWTDQVDVGMMPGGLTVTRIDAHSLSVRVPPPVRPAERVNMTRGTQA